MTVESALNISETEKKAINELRRKMGKEKLPNHLDEEFLFYRFLKARNFDVEEAATMLQKHLEWRRRIRPEYLTSEYTQPEVLKKFFAKLRVGYDKEGSPFHYVPCGLYDLRGLHMAAKYSDIENTLLTWVEEAEMILEEKSKKTGILLKGFTIIFDIAGLTFANATNKKACETMIRLLKTQQDNYPERLKAVFVINASSYFTLFFALVKSFLAPGLLEKIHVLGNDGWKEELLKHIDAEQLPAFLGGNRKDPDGNPLCKTLRNLGGKVDEKYFIHKSVHSLSSRPDAKKLVLPRASFSEIALQVQHQGSVIEWEFETKSRDIGFGLFYQDVVEGEEKITELVPLVRLETETFSETGVYKCDLAGKYVMLFDNSYSWMRSKEIHYVVKVKSPMEVEKSLPQ